MLLRGFLVCPECGRMLTGSASKGRNAHYHYYHCSPSCNVRYKAEDVNFALADLFKKFVAKRPYLGLFKEIARDVFKQRTSDKQNERLQNLLQLETQQTRLKKARELLLNEAIGVQDYQEIKKECEVKIEVLENSLDQLPDMDVSITRRLNKHSKRMLDLYDLYRGASVADKRRLIANVFPDRISYIQDRFIITRLSDFVPMIFKSGIHLSSRDK
jgi:site-specific DNA recombinase